MQHALGCEDVGIMQETPVGARYTLPEVPAAAALRRTLLEGYAAAWLGLVPDQAPPRTTAMQASGWASPWVAQPVGSRLPAPQVGPIPQTTHGAAVASVHCWTWLGSPGPVAMSSVHQVISLS